MLSSTEIWERGTAAAYTTSAMHEFPQYDGNGNGVGDSSFESAGTDYQATDDSTELDMITDDGEIDEEVCHLL